MTQPSPGPGTEHLLRELAPQVLGAMIRRFRDFAASEDAVQVALVAAAHQWPIEARTGPDGELIPLPQQDRSRWDQAQIAEGVALLSATLPQGAVGAYQLQAAVAAGHDEAARHEDTDWPQILALYSLLERMSDNPMVSVNRAVDVAMVEGPAAGLALLTTLDADGRLTGNHRLNAVRAHLLELAGDHAAAATNYLAAAGRTTNIVERNYLLTQAAQLRERGAV